jgi:hypothetical protein
MVPEGTILPINDGKVTVPKIDGYSIISFELA